MEKENNKGKAAVTIILIILILALAGYIAYDKLYLKDDSSKTTTTTTTTTTAKKVDATYAYSYKDLCGEATVCNASKDITFNGKDYKLTLVYDKTKEETTGANYLTIGESKIDLTNKTFEKIGIMNNKYLAISYSSTPTDGHGILLYNSNFEEEKYLSSITDLSSKQYDLTELHNSDYILNNNTFVFATCIGNGSTTNYSQIMTIYSVSFTADTYNINKVYSLENTTCSQEKI